MYRSLALISILSIISSVYGQTKAEDQFTQLPNVTSPMPSNSYSGFLKVSDTKALHYIFVESTGNATSDPVVVWFNGGPGCSSLLGFMQEHGPFVINDNSTVIETNPYPWNVAANMLYIESPAGVGFSVGNTTQDLRHSDTSQSKDAFAALESFFDRFPEKLANELFVSGESYGGIYVPYLSWQIYQNNLQAKFNSTKVTYNLKGFLVGNGATNWDFDVSPSFPSIANDFNLIPTKLYTNYTESGCRVWFNDFIPPDGPEYCAALWDEMLTLTGGLNWYDLYRPVYPDGGLTAEERIGKTMIGGVEREYVRGFTHREYTPWLNQILGPKPEREQVLGAVVSDYFNQNDTRAALHIPDYVQTWAQCVPDFAQMPNGNWSYTVQREASMWIYPILKAAGIRQIFYSGDTDGAVGLAGSREWMKVLNWPIVKKWQPWFTTKTINPEVSGYVVQYEGLDFATVHGVGHMAPQWARKPMQEMFNNWIQNKNWAGITKPLAK